MLGGILFDQALKRVEVGILGEAGKVIADLEPWRLGFEIDMRPGRPFQFFVQTRNDERKQRGLQRKIADRGRTGPAEMANRSHRRREDLRPSRSIGPSEGRPWHKGHRREHSAMNPSTERAMAIPDRTEGPSHFVAQRATETSPSPRRLAQGISPSRYSFKPNRIGMK